MKKVTYAIYDKYNRYVRTVEVREDDPQGMQVVMAFENANKLYEGAQYAGAEILKIEEIES